MNFKIPLLLILLTNITLFAQVKIGENPSTIDSNSVLELESLDKVLVITKMNTTTMNSTTPLKGALVYNTDENCVFSYNGTIWRSLCQTASFITDITAPTDNNTGDFWIDSSKGNIMNIWNGLNWVPINSKIKTGTGIPDNITAPDPIAGDVYIDVATAKTYTYNTATSSWVTQTSTNTQNPVTANNGLTINSTTKDVELGGDLTKPTIITTTATETLAIKNLQTGDITNDDIVTIDANGVLRKVTLNTVLKQEVTKLTVTTPNQDTFTKPDFGNNITVYRNGVRVDFTLENNKTEIKLESDAKCYAGDQIRIVQFY